MDSELTPPPTFSRLCPASLWKSAGRNECWADELDQVNMAQICWPSFWKIFYLDSFPGVIFDLGFCELCINSWSNGAIYTAAMFGLSVGVRCSVCAHRNVQSIERLVYKSLESHFSSDIHFMVFRARLFMCGLINSIFLLGAIWPWKLFVLFIAGMNIMNILIRNTPKFEKKVRILIQIQRTQNCTVFRPKAPTTVNTVTLFVLFKCCLNPTKISCVTCYNSSGCWHYVVLGIFENMLLVFLRSRFITLSCHFLKHHQSCQWQRKKPNVYRSCPIWCSVLSSSQFHDLFIIFACAHMRLVRTNGRTSTVNASPAKYRRFLPRWSEEALGLKVDCAGRNFTRSM